MDMQANNSHQKKSIFTKEQTRFTRFSITYYYFTCFKSDSRPQANTSDNTMQE